MAKAQSYSYSNDMRHVISINYQVNIPTGDVKDFVSKTSFEGLNLNWAYFVAPKLAVGVDLSYNNYHQKIGQKVYRPNEDMAINAAQYRYTQAFPIKAQVKYFCNPYGNVRFYTGLGIGALSAGQHIVVQDLDQWHNSWGFLLSPEIGALIPFGADSPFGANVAVGYNWSTNKSTFGNIDLNNRQSFYVNVGLYLAIF